MKATIQYIKTELQEYYPPLEIEGVTRVIFERLLGYSYTDLILHRNDILDKTLSERIVNIVSRLKKHEPIQYIFGETEFCGLKIDVNPDVLIPRPETEELVEWILETLWLKSPKILDIGTGSGCIALALKNTIKMAKVSGIDISEKAIKTARENAVKNKLDVQFFVADVFDFPAETNERFDVIVSNPPYVLEREKQFMKPNVLRFEPQNALFVSNHDPLIFYRKITHLAKSILNKNGWLFFEINENMAHEMIELLQNEGFSNARIKIDVNAKSRMARAQKLF